jgi:predicted nucleic acid-binding protein
VLRAVIDTNVIVSGLISGKNPPGIIIDSWLYGKFIPIISEDMIEKISHKYKSRRTFISENQGYFS